MDSIRGNRATVTAKQTGIKDISNMMRWVYNKAGVGVLVHVEPKKENPGQQSLFDDPEEDTDKELEDEEQ